MLATACSPVVDGGGRPREGMHRRHGYQRAVSVFDPAWLTSPMRRPPGAALPITGRSRRFG
jgi:hypothetical protein